jgi:phospholipid/cholesterol/gamma-HCH transport system substrate-binding protein
MEQARWAEVKVGVFVVAALAILVLGTLWVAGSAIWSGSRAAYTVRMKDSGGVQPGDSVRFAGVAVGRVEGVELRATAEWPVVFHVALDAGLQLRTDASARITTSGLLGSTYLEIQPGSPEAPELSPGGKIQGETPAGLDEALARVDEIAVKVVTLLDQTSSILEELSSEIGPLLARMEALLSSENADHVQALLTTLRRTMEDAGPRVTTLLDRLDVISRDLETGVADIPELTEQVSALVTDLRGALGPDGTRLSGLMDSGQSTLASADEALDVIVDNRRELETTLADLREIVANLKAFSQQVKERPYSLVRIKPEPDRRPGEGVGEGNR